MCVFFLNLYIPNLGEGTEFVQTCHEKKPNSSKSLAWEIITNLWQRKGLILMISENIPNSQSGRAS